MIQLVLVSKAEMIDELDRKLIQELQRSSRQSYVDLARMLGVVEGTVRKRVKDLQDRK
ncbi:AsnC family transcriptional regulator [Dehalococcoidia bacterium]|nr:AsnC family transcriptional regulator [Dehalococcoidia bacterium]